jgi:hypothetical protein
MSALNRFRVGLVAEDFAAMLAGYWAGSNQRDSA